jgi:hypothetical protein
MTHSKTVRVNGSFVDYHVGTYMFMNCAGPEGPFNTIGQVIFLGNMLPGPVSPSGKIPKSSIDGSSGILSDIQSSLGDVEGLIAKGKKLYELAKTDWSDPSSVLGAIGGVAGIAGLQDVADMAKTAKDLYDKGKQIAQTDWSNPKQALAALAGIANVAGMDGIAKATELASKVRDAIKADWKDPKAALAAATNIMKGTGLNNMVAALASDLITTNDSNGASSPLPANFPKPGASQANSNGSSPSRNSGPKATNGMIPESPEGNPRMPITSDVLAEMKEKNPLAYRRIMDIQERTGSIPPNAFVEVTKPAKDKNGNPIPDSERTAVFVPGEGFSSTPNERATSSLWTVPAGIREVFVAGSGRSVGEFFGMKQKEGNWYLFGGLIDLGSPEMPGAGAGGNAWWVPDKIFGMDFSKYYDYHDKHYYGNDVRLGDMGKILGLEANAFWEGLGSNPLQWPFQALYSGATTTVGTLTALDNSLKDILGKGDFSSLKDFFGNVFGESPLSPNDLGIDNIVAGGCVGPEVPTLPGQSAPGTGSGAPGQGVPPAKGKAGAPDGNASGAGQDGVLITTAQGNPAAAAAAIEAAFRKDNQEALNKAQAEERAKQEQAAKEKAAKEKAEQEKAAKEKADKEKADKEKADKEKAENASASEATGDRQGKAPPERPTPTPTADPKPTPDSNASNPDGGSASPSQTPQPQPAPTPTPEDKANETPTGDSKLPPSETPNPELTPTPESKGNPECQNDFDEWLAKEKKAGVAWAKGLPDCPPKLDCSPPPVLPPNVASSSPQPPNCTESPDPSIWSKPQDPNRFGNYHPDAVHGIRTNTPAGEPGNQCTYDANGALIPGGPSAGTADMSSPGGVLDLPQNILSNDGHGARDVVPYDNALCADGGKPGKNVDEYLKVRPTQEELDRLKGKTGGVGTGK